MKSFSELNTYASTQLEFTDQRGYGVVFDRAVAENHDIDPEFLVTLELPVGIEILEVINYQSADVRLRVDVSSLIGATVDWGTLPSGSVVTESQGVYTINGINSRAIWNQVKQPDIVMPAGYNGDEFQVFVSIIYNQDLGDSSVGERIKSYQVSVNAVTASTTAQATLDCNFVYTAGPTISLEAVFSPTIEVNIIPVEFWLDPATTPFDYNPGASTNFGTAAPTISTISSDATIVYTVTVSASEPDWIENFSMQGGGAPVSFSYDSLNKTATFTGDRTAINTYIPFLQIYVKSSPTRIYNEFTVNFNLTNDQTSASEDLTVFASSDNITYLDQPTDDTYVLNTATTIEGGPTVDPLNLVASGIFQVVIDPYDAAQVAELDGESTVGTGVSSPTRILHSEVNRPVGNSVSMTTVGDRIFAGSPTEHRIYVVNGSSWSQEASFDESDFSYNWEAGLTDISEDGNRVIWWGYQGSVGSHTAQRIYIFSRSGSSWNQEQVIDASTPDYDTRIVGIKINKDSNKFYYVTADGEIGIWSRTATTWSEDHKITGVFNKTVLGYNLVYDFLGMDISGDGAWLSIGTEINFTDSDPTPSLSDPDYNTIIPYYNDRAFIYNDNSLEEEIVMSQAAEYLTVNQPGAVAVDDAGVVFAFGDISGDNAVIFRRVGSTTFSKETNIDTRTDSVHTLFGIDNMSLDSTGTKLLIGGRTGTSGTPNNKPNVMLYLYTSSWSFQEEVGATNQSSTLVDVAYAPDGDSFVYGNPSYTVSTNNKGEVVVYDIVNYGRFQTGTKQLTITGDKSQVNSLIDGFTMTPATDEQDTIFLLYTATDPSATVSQRNHKITRTT